MLESAHGRAREIPRAVERLLGDALEVRDRRDRGEIDASTVAEAIVTLETRLQQLLDRPAITRPANRRLLKHLRREQAAVLTFLRHDDIDATNWRARARHSTRGRQPQGLGRQPHRPRRAHAGNPQCPSCRPATCRRSTSCARSPTFNALAPPTQHHSATPLPTPERRSRGRHPAVTSSTTLLVTIPETAEALALRRASRDRPVGRSDPTAHSARTPDRRGVPLIGADATSVGAGSVDAGHHVGTPNPRDVPPSGPLLLTVRDVEALLQLGRTRTYELIRSGAIPSIRIGRAVRVPSMELSAWIAEQMQTSPRADSSDADA
jgi:excisionase family DNA binding protein